MISNKNSLLKHFTEIKSRLRILILFFICFFIAFYFCKEQLYVFMLSPLSKVVDLGSLKYSNVIYTGLTEAFFSYIKLSGFFAFLSILPVLSWHVYCFIAPALFTREKKIAIMVLILSPLLFFLGFFFVFYFVMPNVWDFFLSFENATYDLPLILQAKIGEYVSLVIRFILAFGFTFQLPIIIMILNLLGVVNSSILIKFRKLSIVLSFIFGAVLTPPDILSQICLAIPMIILYEMSIIILKYLESKDREVKC